MRAHLFYFDDIEKSIHSYQTILTLPYLSSCMRIIAEKDRHTMHFGGGIFQYQNPEVLNSTSVKAFLFSFLNFEILKSRKG